MKKFQFSIRSFSGRNCKGHLTAFRKGGGFKRRFTFVDFERTLVNIPALVLSKRYDSFRSSFISLVLYKNGFLSYVLTSRALAANQIIFSTNYAFLYRLGDTLPLRFLQIGTLVHSVELVPGIGAKLLRAAGVYGKVWRHEGVYTVLRLRSGEERLFHGRCRATVGTVSNDMHHLKKYFKAGSLRKLGIRPTVRGIAMNPIDHPNGGRTKGGTPFTDRWGNLSKGGRTSRYKKNRFILRARFV